MVEVIEFKGEISSQFQFEESPRRLVNLKKINVFIGANNSGKSRLLRSLISSRSDLLFYNPILSSSPRFTRFTLAKNSVLSGIDKVLKRFEVGDSSELCTNLIRNMEMESEDELSKLFKVVGYLKTLTRENISRISGLRETTSTMKMLEDLRVLEQKFLSKPQIDEFVEFSEASCLYIPILRGLRPLFRNEDGPFLDKDIYLDRTIYDYFEAKDKEFIFTGLSTFDEILQLITGREEERNLIIAFEKFLKEHVFLEKISLISNLGDKVLHIKIGSEDQRPIYNIGDGFQTLIIILFPLFIRKSDHLIALIEEPEIHLHPKWQARLLRTLQSPEFKNHQFFISTHSSAFTNDENIALFHVNRHKAKSIVRRVLKNDHKLNILSDLGYKPTDLLLSNFIIWVEGASDRIYLRSFISKVDPELQKGIHYSILQFGGSSYKDLFLNEDDPDLGTIRSINPNFAIVLDSDRKSAIDKLDSNCKKVETLFKSIDRLCWVTTYREMENYIPIATFREAAQELSGLSEIKFGEDPYDDRFDVINPNKRGDVSPKIKLPDSLMDSIKSKDGSLEALSAEKIREGLESALEDTRRARVKLKKVPLSRIIVEKDFELDDEIMTKVTELTKKIREVNGMKLRIH